MLDPRVHNLSPNVGTPHMGPTYFRLAERHLNAVVGKGGRPGVRVAAIERRDVCLARLFDRLCVARFHAYDVLLVLL
jgi:hypothetical protein